MFCRYYFIYAVKSSIFYFCKALKEDKIWGNDKQQLQCIQLFIIYVYLLIISKRPLFSTFQV